MKACITPLLLALTLAGCSAGDDGTGNEAAQRPATSRYKQTLDKAQQSADQLEKSLSRSAGRADAALEQAH